MSETATKEKPWSRWDISELTQQHIDFLVEEAEAGEEPITREEACERAYEDSCFIDDWWNDFLEDLWDNALEVINPGHWWKASVENFGWRGLDGNCPPFKADDAAMFLHRILPDCDCTFNIFIDEKTKKIRIQNFHHDSPTGNEWYFIAPCEDPEGE